MTLVEVLISLMLLGLFAGALINGFLGTMRANNASQHAFAANLLAMQRVEQVRAARWDALRFPILDEVLEANFPPQVSTLDLPARQSNPIWATNFTSITTVSTNPFLKMVRVDCVYSPDARRVVTNTLVAYRGTESGQQNAFAAVVPLGAPLPPPPPEGTTTNTPTSNFREEGRDYDWDDDDDDDDDDDLQKPKKPKRGDRYGWGDWKRRRGGDRDDD